MASQTEISMRTRFTEAFGIPYPIVCAPMALVTGGRLPAAVSRAGGLGIVGGGFAGPLGGEPGPGEGVGPWVGPEVGGGVLSGGTGRPPPLAGGRPVHSPHLVVP